MVEYKRGNRTVSQQQFFDGISDDMLELAMEKLADETHGRASAVVDPNTGRHAPVFVRRVGKQSLKVLTEGSPEMVRAMEKRLGLEDGEVSQFSEPTHGERVVYLAHAWEDKDVAKPLAEGLMASGIEVWFDEWEIRGGDSLRRKMEEGLEKCTHFIVLLTPNSVRKPWVAEEIDVGLLQFIEGRSKFLGLRANLELEQLSPFLRTRLCPPLVEGQAGVDKVAGEIFGVSRKPLKGDVPKYVQSHAPGNDWSAAALVVAEYFVRNSVNAVHSDVQTTYSELTAETGMPESDVRIGVLDLVGSGLLEKQEFLGGSSLLSAASQLYSTFDAFFLDWNPKIDARELAVHLFNLEMDTVDAEEVANALNWPPRRFNPASNYLVEARVVEPFQHMGGNFDPSGFMIDDELLRFVKNL